MFNHWQCQLLCALNKTFPTISDMVSVMWVISHWSICLPSKTNWIAWLVELNASIENTKLFAYNFSNNMNQCAKNVHHIKWFKLISDLKLPSYWLGENLHPALSCNLLLYNVFDVFIFTLNSSQHRVFAINVTNEKHCSPVFQRVYFIQLANQPADSAITCTDNA